MTEVICHRGYSSRYPENTMLAVQKAVKTQADGMEWDVHLTRDGEVVVMHDELVDRTTDGTGFVKDYTWAELRRLDASGPFRGKVRPQRVPALKEYLEFIAPTNFKTNIELKTETFDYNGIEEKVWNLVQAFGLEDRVLFSSFHAQSLLRLKEIAPAAPCGLLNKDKLPHAGRVIRDFGFEAYHPLYLRLRPSVIRDLKEHGIQINTYTVNGHGSLTYLLAWDVHSVITNYPERAIALRRLMQGKTALTNPKNVVK